MYGAVGAQGRPRGAPRAVFNAMKTSPEPTGNLMLGFMRGGKKAQSRIPWEFVFIYSILYML